MLFLRTPCCVEVECLGIVGVDMCGVPWDFHLWVCTYMCGLWVCVHVCSAIGLWVLYMCGIVGVYMCVIVGVYVRGVPRD